MSGDQNKDGRAHVSILASSFVSINTLDRMRVGTLIARLFSMARQASYPTVGREADRSLSHHMYYTRRQARYPALVQQGVHQHMIQAALNKLASQAPIQSGRARMLPSRFVTLQY